MNKRHEEIILNYIQAPPIATAHVNARKKQVLFIVNPLSHGLKGRNLKKIIKQSLDESIFEYSIVFTQHPNHASELTQAALKQQIDIVVAVGGDGTVNEVGKVLTNTDVPLSILPLGSGNGLARHLRIPIDLVQAIMVLNQAHPVAIDTAKVNNEVFLGVAGMGFDALVAREFAKSKRRGFSSYLRTVAREFPNYHPRPYSMCVDGRQISGMAFIISFANSSQYGNDFIIAPQARLQDGYIDLVIVKDIPFYAIQQFIYRIKGGTLHLSNYVDILRCKEIIIKQPQIEAHIDGEPIIFQDEIKVSIQPASLKIMVPSF